MPSRPASVAASLTAPTPFNSPSTRPAPSIATADFADLNDNGSIDNGSSASVTNNRQLCPPLVISSQSSGNGASANSADLNFDRRASKDRSSDASFSKNQHLNSATGQSSQSSQNGVSTKPAQWPAVLQRSLQVTAARTGSANSATTNNFETLEATLKDLREKVNDLEGKALVEKALAIIGQIKMI